MLGRDVLAGCDVVQHDADDGAAHVALGVVPGSDVPARIDRRFLEADVRVTLGFVEPHFFAGFSGGPKMVAPGLAALDTIRELHSASRIGSDRATWGVTDGNPVHDPIRAIAERAQVSFALDVALDDGHRIAAVFAGTLDAEHRAACDHVRRTAMVGVSGAVRRRRHDEQRLPPRPEPVPVRQGAPRRGGDRPGRRHDHPRGRVRGRTPFARPVRGAARSVLRTRRLPGRSRQGRDRGARPVAGPGPGGDPDPARVLAHTPGVAPDDLRRAWMEPVDDVSAALRDAIAAAGPGARAAILPVGPQTIAYLARGRRRRMSRRIDTAARPAYGGQPLLRREGAGLGRD